jgi:hypothetical protein
MTVTKQTVPKARKMQLQKERIEYLDIIISEGQVEMDLVKVAVWWPGLHPQ